MARRERATIFGELLRQLAELGGQATTTRLAARANVSYDRFLVMLEELRQAGLVASDEPLRLTPAGHQFLERYRQWLEALRLLGLGD